LEVQPRGHSHERYRPFHGAQGATPIPRSRFEGTIDRSRAAGRAWTGAVLAVARGPVV